MTPPPFYKQLNVETNRTKPLCGNRSGHHNTNTKSNINDIHAVSQLRHKDAHTFVFID